MLKYLIIALILVLLFYSPLLRSPRRKPGGGTGAKPAPPAAENMVACAHCGVHLPDGDAVRDEKGRIYCSPAHRQAGPARS